MKLPIYGSREMIIETVKNNKVIILVGETGSGKTTQLPIYLFEAGLVNGGMLGITQPRRLAAVSVAEYVCGQLAEGIGGVVGYQVRFDMQVAEDTKIKFMTDGILLRELQLDPELSKYSIIMVDEAHERSQNIDFVLGLLKDLLLRRDDLKVVVTSATIDQEKFSKYFWGAPVVNVSGRTYQVEDVWANRNYYQWEMADAIVEKILDIHTEEEPGDLLVFVPGIDDINTIISKVEEKGIADLVLLPAHGNLDPSDQRKIFQSYPGQRKVAVGTNILETSITVEDVAYAIDSGLIKQVEFHAASGIQSLEMAQHSQAGCNQRKGRAGRTRPGKCFHMYTKEDFEKRPQFTTPEIMRSSLSNVVLMMEDIGIDPVTFDFIDKPDSAAFKEAYETLIVLGAIMRGKKGLTDTGKFMAKLPLEPRIAKMILVAQKYECVKEVATIAAFMSAKSVFARPRGKEGAADWAHFQFKSTSSDALTFLSVWQAYESANFSAEWCFENYLNSKALEEIGKIRSQIIAALYHNGIEISSGVAAPNDVTKAVTSGLVYNLFVLQDLEGFAYEGALRGVYEVYIHPGSALFHARPSCMVAAKVMETSKRYAHMVTFVKTEWLKELVPHLCVYGDMELISYDEQSGKVLAKRKVTLKEIDLGYEELSISVQEARLIQYALMKRAEAEGYVQLRFKTEKGAGVYDTRSIAYHWGQPVIAYSTSQIDDGALYMCKIESFLQRSYASPKFRVIEFPAAQQQVTVEKTESRSDNRSSLNLSKLAAKWGK